MSELDKYSRLERAYPILGSHRRVAHSVPPRIGPMVKSKASLGLLTLFFLVPQLGLAQSLEAIHTLPLGERINALYAIKGQYVSEKDQALLLSWIDSPLDYSNLNPAQSDLFFNELLVVVRSLPNSSKSDLAQRLIDLIQDEDRRIVHRDYAMQHLVHLNVENTWPAEKHEVLFEAAENQNNQLASTALRSLERLYKAQKLNDAKRLKTLTLTGLKKKGAAKSYSHLLQLAVTLKLEEALPYIRETVFGEDMEPNRQLVGLYALGELGSAEDYKSLTNLIQVPSRCKIAKQSAEKKLKTRI